MNRAESLEESLLLQLQRALPLVAHGRPSLLAFLRARRAVARGSPRLTSVGVLRPFDGGDLICRFVIEGRRGDRSFLAPLAELALDRSHPLAREADRRRRQTR